jgi:glycosyltransferase involved in cell wall biosynthesis
MLLRRGGNFLDYATGGIGSHIRAHDGLPYFEQHGLMGERLHGRVFAKRQIPASLAAARRLLQDVLTHHREGIFTSEFMAKLDGATMHYALEAREPFLDRDLWEFAAALPPHIHFRGGRLKAVLREIVRRRMGAEIAFRPKQGFTVPAERWYATRWRGMLKVLQGETLLESQGWIRRGSLSPLIERATRSKQVPISVVRLLVLEHWLRAHASPGARQEAGDKATAQNGTAQERLNGNSMPVKVAVLIDTLKPDAGNELLLIRLVKAFDPQLVEAHVCCFEATERLANLGPAVRTAVFPLEKILSMGGLWQMLRFRRYVQENGIDASHSFAEKTSIFSTLALLGERGRAVITSRLNCGYTYTPGLLKAFRVLNRHSTHILANSIAAKRVAAAMEGVSPEKISVFYPGVDLARFTPLAGEASRAGLGFAPGQPVVGIVANFRPVKNLQLFVRAAAHVAAAVPEARFLLVGHGSLEGELRETARSVGIAERIAFSRPDIAVPDYLAAMSVACLSSDSESLPNAIMEYMACGLPVVATDVGGVSELVRDGETGYLVRTHTPQAFAEPIIRLLQDPELRAAMGRRSLERARREFDSTAATRRLEQFYLEAVASVQGSRLQEDASDAAA